MPRSQAATARARVRSVRQHGNRSLRSGQPAAEQVDVQRGPSISYIGGPRTYVQDDASRQRIRGTTRADVVVLTADRPAPGAQARPATAPAPPTLPVMSVERPERGGACRTSAAGCTRSTPRRDGDPDSEVVWAWVPFQEDPAQGKDRPIVVTGRDADDAASGGSCSPKDHDGDHDWRRSAPGPDGSTAQLGARRPAAGRHRDGVRRGRDPPGRVRIVERPGAVPLPQAEAPPAPPAPARTGLRARRGRRPKRVTLVLVPLTSQAAAQERALGAVGHQPSARRSRAAFAATDVTQQVRRGRGQACQDRRAGSYDGAGTARPARDRRRSSRRPRGSPRRRARHTSAAAQSSAVARQSSPPT
jgi:hypothetical protein